jgi:hypothetical protein
MVLERGHHGHTRYCNVIIRGRAKVGDQTVPYLLICESRVDQARELATHLGNVESAESRPGVLEFQKQFVRVRNKFAAHLFCIITDVEAELSYDGKPYVVWTQNEMEVFLVCVDDAVDESIL